MKIRTTSLTREEFLGLMRLARAECRTPNEHLRYLVRSALGLSEPPNGEKKDNRTVVHEATGTAVPTQSPRA